MSRRQLRTASRRSSGLRWVAGTVAATHEAGHAVAAVVLRLSLQYVTLRPKGNESGLTYTRKVRNESPDYFGREAVCALAGIAAELEREGRVTPGGPADDLPHARRIAERLRIADVDEFLTEKLAAARALVAEHREAVESVRRALVERRTLQGSEARRIVLRLDHPATAEPTLQGDPVV